MTFQYEVDDMVIGFKLNVIRMKDIFTASSLDLTELTAYMGSNDLATFCNGYTITANKSIDDIFTTISDISHAYTDEIINIANAHGIAGTTIDDITNAIKADGFSSMFAVDLHNRQTT